MEDSLALKDTADYLAKNTDGTVVLKATISSSSLFGEIPGMESGSKRNGRHGDRVHVQHERR